MGPLTKVQDLLDQASKLEGDAESKERKKLLGTARELIAKMEKNLQGLVDVSKQTAQLEPRERR
jgi:hypothetical protein